MPRIKLITGHHNFTDPRPLFNPDGTEAGDAKSVHPGDIFEVSEKEFKNSFHYRAEEYKAPESSEIIYEAVSLAKTYSVKELKAIAKDRGCTGYSKLGEKALISMILEAVAAEEELTPSDSWSEDRLKAFLDEAEVDYEEAASAEDLLALALATYQA